MSETPGEAARLRAIAEREQRATKGPWSWEDDGNEATYGKTLAATLYADRNRMMHGLNLLGRLSPDANGFDNLQFIAAARSDVPYLLSLVSRQAQEIQDLRAEREHQQSFIDLLTRGESLCGHWSAHAVIVDPELKGKQIECLDCKVERLSSSRDALREALKEAIAYLRTASIEKLTVDSHIAFAAHLAWALAETPTEDR